MSTAELVGAPPLATQTVVTGESAEHPVEYLLRTGRFLEASWILDRYVERFPNDASCIGNLAICHAHMGQNVKSLEMYRRALAISPDNPKLLHEVGRMSMICGEYDAAAVALRSLIKAEPGYSEGYGLLGMVLRCQRKFDEAIEVYRSFERATGQSNPHIDSSIVFTLEMDERSTLDQRLAARAEWYEKHKAPWQFNSWSNDRNPERPLTIGYVSGDFRIHSAAYAFRPLILDRDKSKFRAVCISIDPSVDWMTASIKESADAFHILPTDNDEQIAWVVRNERVDILVDLSGHTPGNRLRMFTTRPAPIQITGIGCVGSAGIPDIGYTMVDEGYVPLWESQRYVEMPMYLPNAIHFKLQHYAPSVAPAPCAENGFVTFGCLQHFSKVTDLALSTWGAILRAVPTAKILIKDDVVTTPAGRERVLRLLNVDPERVILMDSTPHAQHLADHAKIDIALDTWPQNGGVTTLEAIAMGVPVINLTGDRPYQRGGLSVARHLARDVTVTEDVDSYIRAAVRVATEGRDDLIVQRSKRRWRLEKSSLGDAEKWVREVERSYREVWRHWCRS